MTAWQLVTKIAALLLLAPVCFSANPEAKRPKVGLALGGGGALGLAHVGVLCWLEEHRIPVDLITGTSMGAIVGGCYAAGFSSSEIEQLVRGISWVEIFRGSPPFIDLGYRRKEDRREFPNQIELGLRHGIAIPSALTSGQGLTVFLDRLLGIYPADLSFEDLPTPFRCIATDLISGDAVTLDSGPLTEALRASAAIPGVFKPIRRDGRILVDGGVVDNLPVGAVRKMGADTTIAVPLAKPDLREEEILGLGGILTRSVSVAVLQNERASMRQADILVQPETGKFTSASYEAVEPLLEAGWRAAEQAASQLLPLSLDDPSWAVFLKQRQARRRQSAPALEFVEVQGGSENAQQSVKASLRPELANPGDFSRIDRKLAYEYGSMRYSTVSRSLIYRDGRPGLGIQLTGKRHGPPFIYVAPVLDGSEASRVTFTLNTRLVVLDAGSYNSELRADLGFGARDRAALEYHRRLGQRGWFVAPHLGYERSQTNLFEDRLRIGEYDLKRTGLGFDTGFTTARFFEVRAGFDYGRISTPVLAGLPLPPQESGVFRYFSLQAAYDGQDSPVIPRRGVRMSGKLQYYLSAPMTGEFPLLQLGGSVFHSIQEKNRIFLGFRAGSSFGQALPIPLQFTLGGPLALGTFDPGERRGDRMGYGVFGYLQKVGSLPAILGGNLYFGGWHELGFTSLGSVRDFNQDLSLGFVAETPLGPFFLGGSVGQHWRGKFSFMLGRFF